MLLDLLADGPLNYVLIRRDQVAALRAGSKQRLFNRQGNVVGLRVLAHIQYVGTGQDSR